MIGVESKALTFQIEEEKRARVMPTCGYCKDCQHWESDAIRREGLMSGSELGFGFCRIAECKTGEPKEVGNRLACGDGYDYGALLCKPDFGCVQFEARREAQWST